MREKDFEILRLKDLIYKSVDYLCYYAGTPILISYNNIFTPAISQRIRSSFLSMPIYLINTRSPILSKSKSILLSILSLPLLQGSNSKLLLHESYISFVDRRRTKGEWSLLPLCCKIEYKMYTFHFNAIWQCDVWDGWLRRRQRHNSFRQQRCRQWLLGCPKISKKWPTHVQAQMLCVWCDTFNVAE